MDKRIAVLALASFALGTQTFVFSGLLVQLATDLGVSIGSAGQLTSVFAIVYAVAAPVLAGLAAPYDRKRILVVALTVGGLVIEVAGLAHVGFAAASVALVGVLLALGSPRRTAVAHPTT